MPIKLVTYNVNGIRAAIRKGLIDWIAQNDFDLICFQETKSQPDQIDMKIFNDLGYSGYWNSAEKKGYSGVLTLSKLYPNYIDTGIGIKKFDREGRVLRTDFGDWTLLNCYFPSGTSSEERHEFKMKFLKSFRTWVFKLLNERPNLVVVGDYNIVHQGMDIHNPNRRDNPSGYRPGERAWLNRYFKKGFTDVFRYTNPEKIEFSWWSYRAGARANNKGWRIDYSAVSKPMEKSILNAYHEESARHSDHCPLIVQLNI